MTTPAPVAPAAPAVPATAAPKAPATPAPDPKAPPAVPAATAAGTPPAGGAAPAAPSEKKYKLKVDGKDIEVSEADLVRHAQTGMSAEERFTSASKMKKQAEDIIRLLKTDPWAVLKHPSLGHDPRKLAEDYLSEIIAEEKLSPEQREAKQNQRRLRELEEEKAQRERDDQSRKLNELRALYRVEFERDIIGALDSSKLPKTTDTVKRIAYYLSEGFRKGMRLKAVDVVPLVREDLINGFKALTMGAEGDILMQIVGEEGAKKIREFEMKRLGGQPPAPPAPKGGTPQADDKPLDKEEWRRRLDERTGKI